MVNIAEDPTTKQQQQQIEPKRLAPATNRQTEHQHHQHHHHHATSPCCAVKVETVDTAAAAAAANATFTTALPVSNAQSKGRICIDQSESVKIKLAGHESFNQLTLPTLEYENKKMSLFGDVCETQFHYADFTEIGNYRTENTLNGEIEIYLDVQPLFDPNYNPLYVSN